MPKHVEPFPDPPIPDIDDEGIMVPPWVKFPNVPRESMGWRMGVGESYVAAYSAWYSRQTRDTHKAVWKKYPEPEPWSGFYRRLNAP